MDSFTVLSLCVGIGGIDLGLKLALGNARTVGYVEIEASAAAILAARCEDGSLDDAPIWTDLKTFRGRPWRGVVDCVVAGYPCQPFSCAGKQLGEKDPRHLWPEVARIVREVQPGWVFLENVDAHLRLGFRQVARELRRLGYHVAPGLFTAAEVGAPHLRRRLFIAAHAAKCGRTKSAEQLHVTTQSIKKPRSWNEWHVAPSRLQRVAYGSTAGMDRLHACGNGVVPLVAAHAFRTLVSYFHDAPH